MRDKDAASIPRSQVRDKRFLEDKLGYPCNTQQGVMNQNDIHSSAHELCSIHISSRLKFIFIISFFLSATVNTLATRAKEEEEKRGRDIELLVDDIGK